MRLYPTAHRQVFGKQMIQTLQDHYRDAVEVRGESEVRFWLNVASDEGKSIAREHLAALAGRIWPVVLTQVCLIAAMLLIWTPLLAGRVCCLLRLNLG